MSNCSTKLQKGSLDY